MRTRRPAALRYDRTLRVVMWSDAFLSVALVAVGLVASPVVALVGVPPAILFSVAVASMVCAVLLAAFGAVTAVVIMLRMHHGNYWLPADLWLPLPAGVRPSRYAPARRSARVKRIRPGTRSAFPVGSSEAIGRLGRSRRCRDSPRSNNNA